MAEDTRISLIDITKPYPLVINRDGEGGGTLALSVTEEIGRGASCIAYRAIEGPGKTRILKELYPQGSDVSGVVRDKETASLSIPDDEALAFEERRNRFVGTIGKFNEYWEWDSGLHEAPRPFEYGSANGTLYAVSDPPAGSLLTDAPPSDMHGIAEVMLSVCNALKSFHGHKDDMGNPDPLLYLDLKPDNLYTYELDGVGHVLLFDFDTVVRAADLKERNYKYSSYSIGWAPPEQVRWRTSKISEASDAYSLGAVFFWLITGRRPTRSGDEGLECASDLDLLKESEFRWAYEKRKHLAFDDSGDIQDKVSEIIGKTLVENPSKRCSSINDLASDFELLCSITLKDDTIISSVKSEGEATRSTMAASFDDLNESLEKKNRETQELIEKNSARSFFASKKVIAIIVVALLAIALVVGALMRVGSNAVDAVSGGSAQIDTTIDEHLLLQLDNANHQYETGLENWRRLDYNRADRDITAARDEISKQVAQSEVEVAKVNNSLGSLYLDMGKYRDAYDYLNASYVTFRDAYGDASLEARAAKFNIAEYDYYTGDFDSALKELQTILDTTDPQTEKSVIASVNRLRGMISDARGQYSDAIAQYEDVLQLYADVVQDGKLVSNLENYANDSSLSQSEKERYTQDLIWAAQTYSSMSDVYLHQGDYASAVKAAQIGLSICLDNVYIGKKNLVTSDLYKSLALAESGQGDNSKALDDIDLAMRIQLNLFDFEGVYPGLVEVYDAYGSILQASNKSAEASVYYEKALDLSVESFGENHPQTARACCAIGEFEANEKAYGAAIEYFNRGIEIRKNVLGYRHPDTALLYVNLAEAQIALGELDSAAESANSALTICDELGLDGELKARAEAASSRSRRQ